MSQSDLFSPEDIGNVVGPIDDIFLLYIPGYYSNNDRMALWNPAMREFNRLHVLEPIFLPNFHAVTNVVGFGLNPLTRDYKIIWIRDFVETIGDETYDLYYPYHVAAIYTLGKDSWRHFDLLTIPKDRTIYNSLCATCINGAYYWLSGLDYSEHRILSFDMRLEEFREIEGLDHPEPKWRFLSLYNDSIDLFLCQTV
ncbi:F-box/kelch-repeat protein At3g06240-like [Camellia sinensis]|uniref:F-box/kelch-repeat protein At3g06240-like n=1 Tax=Camellia sinensis TaxID=4442 RepID=UPI0010366DBF|nr:F-box/kelch-repeat protein At3g06240-like [Camellia sinensis]